MPAEKKRLKKYRVYCTTEQSYIQVWAETEPTVCPNNAEHSISTTKTAIIEQVNEEMPTNPSGIPRIHESSIPFGTITYFTSKGDNVEIPTDVGNGETLLLSHAISGSPIETVYIDFNIAPNKTYLHEGYIQWTDAKGDSASLEIVPRLAEYELGTGYDYTLYNGYLIIPAVQGQGNCNVTSILTDLSGGLVYTPLKEDGSRPTSFWNADFNTETNKYENIAPAPYGDGEYNIFGYEIVMSKFVNNIVLLNSGFMMLQTADTAELGEGMRLRLSGHTNQNTDDHNWSLASIITMHRIRIS